MLDLVVGRYYVDRARQNARQVVRIDAQTVHFISYHLDTGQSDGNLYQCPQLYFLRWADHEASAGELNNLQSRMTGHFH
jgi:hypothetical protein